jgi:hypothetical protein
MRTRLTDHGFVRDQVIEICLWKLQSRALRVEDSKVFVQTQRQ